MASDVHMRIANGAAPAGGGTQDLTVAGWGKRPVAALIICTTGISDQAEAAHAIVSIGATDGTTHRVATCHAKDGDSTPDTNQVGATDEVVMILDAEGDAVDGEANFVEFIDDGIKLNWANAPSGDFLVTAILYAGTDLSANVGDVTTGGTIGNTVDYDPGFTGEADSVFCFGNNLTFDDSIGSVSHLALGFADNQATIVNRATCSTSSTGGTTSALTSRTADARCFLTLNLTGGSVNRAAEVTDFGAGAGSDEIKFTTQDANQSSTIGLLCLQFGGGGHKIVDYNPGNSPGTKASPSVGFKPQGVLQLIHQNSSFNSSSTNLGAGVTGLAAYTADETYTNLKYDEDGQGTSNTASKSDSRIYMWNANGADGKIATLASMDSDGWTLDFSVNGGASVLQWCALAIEEAAAAGETLVADAGSFSVTGVNANLEVGRLIAADAGSLTLTGFDSNLLKGSVVAADSGSFALAGIDAGTLKGSLLDVESGSFVLTGVDAGLSEGNKLDADVGAFSVTGVVAGLERGFTVLADTGLFVLTGEAAGVNVGFSVGAETGTFAMTGEPADTLAGITLSADVGAFTVTGVDAGLQRAIFLAADAGSFTVIGVDVGTFTASLMTADAGSFVITGEDASTQEGIGIAALAGAFVVTGVDADLLTATIINADSGAFAITGEEAETTTGILLAADTGTFLVVGQDANLFELQILVAETGTFTITGEAANLLEGNDLTAETGTFAITGEEAGVFVGFIVDADTGLFSITGVDADFLLGRVLPADTGLFAIDGQEAFTLEGLVLSAEAGLLDVTGIDAGTLKQSLLVAEPGLFTLAGQDTTLYRTQSVAAVIVSKGAEVSTGSGKGAKISTGSAKGAVVSGVQVVTPTLGAFSTGFGDGFNI